DELLAAYVEDEAAVSSRHLHDELARQSRGGLVHPVFFGSAITGAGVGALTAGITELLPAVEGGAEAMVSGTVFKIERGPSGEKIAYVRLFAGTVRTRDQLPMGQDRTPKVTAISVFERGSVVQRGSLAAGQIGKLWGLGDVRIGDAIGLPPRTWGHSFAPPTLESIVLPGRAEDRGRLYTALTQLAEQDPLINLRRDPGGAEVSVSLYGEVQKEVIWATLANDFDILVTFAETTTICIERPVGSGAAVEIISKDPNPFLATVGLRIDPAPMNSGVEFRLEVELGSMPFTFFKAVEDTVRETLHEGLYGWEVIDCTVTMTHSGYYPRQSHSHAVFDKSMSSTAGDFRLLTPLVLMAALTQAGTRVSEPMHRFHLDLPADALGPVLGILARLRGVPQTPARRGSSWLLDGDIPAAQVDELTIQLPGLTHGEGVLESAFGHYEPVRGNSPIRRRSDPDPLNRKEYLLQVVRRVSGPRSGT
ncbi:MAG: TetM/TetW/TetO/TetS family tetracycline resistance ribosomal protection protein, partial [Propionibacteriaceae bacterium]|nr:TetM/TetW/TetO/TetS family tetracycline resistance ribosomal protection protein [Propionibacteriaceae bacterium]